MKKYVINTNMKIEELEGTQKIILELASGKRTPRNKKEQDLLKQIKEIEKKGNILDLPFE
ncbi:hypothetical protein [Christiangramia fulva]|nr:hypothetical protein [Christiangramia fulva]